LDYRCQSAIRNPKSEIQKVLCFYFDFSEGGLTFANDHSLMLNRIVNIVSQFTAIIIVVVIIIPAISGGESCM